MTGQSCVSCPKPLTDRELGVASLLAQGLSTETIARELSLSPHTIAAHLAKMLRNLNVRNRTELVARLYAHGILASGEWPPRATPARNFAPHESSSGDPCRAVSRAPAGDQRSGPDLGGFSAGGRGCVPRSVREVGHEGLGDPPERAEVSDAPVPGLGLQAAGVAAP
jgi:DNA-binding CsgD family transcriptional regulator